MPPTLRTRKPTCRPAWPLILLAGAAKSGKTYQAAQLTGDPRVGRSFVLDLGEGSADEYGAVPGADYEIIDHNGQWVDIIGQVEAVRDLAKAELAAGRPPVCLIIDSMTAEWAMLSAWVDTRARRSTHNRKLLAENPDAEIDISSNYWNDANSRHNRLMNILKTFPGIVVMTALETEKTQFGPNGRPLPNAPKIASPDCQKRVTADATAWIRLSHDNPPTVVGLRSLRQNVQPGKDKPQPWPDFTLAGLVFDFLGLGVDTAQVRDVPVLDADQHVDGETPDEAPARPVRQVRPAPQQAAPAQAPQPQRPQPVPEVPAEVRRARDKVLTQSSALGWDTKQLKADFAERVSGDIFQADATTLEEYAEELRQEVEMAKQAEGLTTTNGQENAA